MNQALRSLCLRAGEQGMDEMMVDQTGNAMARRMTQKRNGGQAGRRHGWWDPNECRQEDLWRMLQTHLFAKENVNWIDVLNTAAMLYIREELGIDEPDITRQREEIQDPDHDTDGD